MRIAFYTILVFLSRFLGTWILDAGILVVTAGFFILFPGRVKNSIRFFQRVEPDRSFLHYLSLAWKQFQAFSSIFKNRIVLEKGEVSWESEGMEYLQHALEEGKGAILLMSHYGNWEMAAHLLRNQVEGLTLFMGEKKDEKLERPQKEHLGKNRVEVVAVPEMENNPFQLIDALTVLKRGEILSLTGDRLRGEDDRSLTVDFLGGKIKVPEGPHLLARLSGAPLLVFFARIREDGGLYFRFYRPCHVPNPGKKEREKVIRESALRYVELLEEQVRESPWNWFHFENVFID